MQEVNTEINTMEQEQTLEELFARAEELVGKLQDPEISLEDSFEAYQQGMQIIRACNSRIDQVEKKMLMMDPDGELVDFDAADGSEK
jgi:exodeoxyribonuclease VII small subunit